MEPKRHWDATKDLQVAVDSFRDPQHLDGGVLGGKVLRQHRRVGVRVITPDDHNTVQPQAVMGGGVSIPAAASRRTGTRTHSVHVFSDAANCSAVWILWRLPNKARRKAPCSRSGLAWHVRSRGSGLTHPDPIISNPPMFRKSATSPLSISVYTLEKMPWGPFRNPNTCPPHQAA